MNGVLMRQELRFRRVRMSKNIVICLDGTGNEFGDTNSNVIKLFATLQRDPARQVIYYHPGLGTSGEMESPTYLGRAIRWVRIKIGLAFGIGFFPNLGHAYHFLMENYQPGDKIFLFGFSRGAYTAKALAALIYQFGVIEKGNDILVEYAVALFKKHSDRNKKTAKAFQSTFGQDVTIHFVGLWDAVSSVGWAYNPLKLSNTRNNLDIKTGRHAQSVDERRCFFRQNSWGASGEGQDLRQVWFPGVHSDIGGGYPEGESGLSKITLRWMLREAEASGLLIDQAEKAKILGGSPDYVAPNTKGMLHNSLTGGWWITEYLPKLYWNGKKDCLKWPRGESRFIPENYVLHESVELRKAEPKNAYAPANLPKAYTVEKEPV
jgi:uncharacterized protein (DUF2235 family)